MFYTHIRLLSTIWYPILMQFLYMLTYMICVYTPHSMFCLLLRTHANFFPKKLRPYQTFCWITSGLAVILRVMHVITIVLYSHKLMHGWKLVAYRHRLLPGYGKQAVQLYSLIQTARRVSPCCGSVGLKRMDGVSAVLESYREALAAEVKQGIRYRTAALHAQPWCC